MGIRSPMMASLSNRFFPGVVLLASLSAAAVQQDTHQTVRHHAAAQQTPSAASALLDQAEALLANGDYSSAQPLLEKAAVKDPKSYQAWYDLGYCEQALNHNSEALSAYKKSLEISPKIFETNLNLGLLLANSGERDQAISYLRTATELQPASHPERGKQHAWLALGKLQLSSKPEDAEQALAEAAKLNPADPEPHMLLGDLSQNANKLELAKMEYPRA